MTKICIETMSDGSPPAARSAATTLPAATSNCSVIVVPTIVLSGPSAVCPPSATTRPGAASDRVGVADGRRQVGGRDDLVLHGYRPCQSGGRLSRQAA